MSTQVQEPLSQAKNKKKRGHESAADMVRSLGLVLLVVLPVWFFAQAPDSDEVPLRVVDPAQAIAAFAADVPAAPVPGTLPAHWRPTSATYEGQPQSLRVGYVTPAFEYAEYSASTAPRKEFLEQAVGEDVEQLEPVTVDGVVWQRYRDPDGSVSLVHGYGDATVVVGSRRASASLAELEVLLRSLTTR